MQSQQQNDITQQGGGNQSQILTLKHQYFQIKQNLEKYSQSFYTAAIDTFKKLLAGNLREYQSECREHNLKNIDSRSIQNMLTVPIYMIKFWGGSLSQMHKLIYSILEQAIQSKKNPDDYKYEYHAKYTKELKTEKVQFKGQSFTLDPYIILKDLNKNWKIAFDFIFAKGDMLNATCWAYFSQQFSPAIIKKKHEQSTKAGICSIYLYCRKFNVPFAEQLKPLIEILKEKDGLTAREKQLVKQRQWDIEQCTIQEIQLYARAKSQKRIKDNKNNKNNNNNNNNKNNKNNKNNNKVYLSNIKLSPNRSIGKWEDEVQDKFMLDSSEEEKIVNIKLDL